MSNSCYYARLLLSYTLKNPMPLKRGVQCKKAMWKSSRQLGKLQKGRGNQKNVPKCSNPKQFSTQPHSADSQHRDESLSP